MALSIDGRINDRTPGCLDLSNTADFDRVDQVRADSDAIMIGAGTMRDDNPRLLIKSDQRRAARVASGRSEQLTKVTVTRSGDLPPDLRWFHWGGDKIVYTTDTVAPQLHHRLGDLAEVVSLGPDISFAALLDDLGHRHITQLMVEGGQQVHTTFLSEGLVDELHLAVAPLLIGDGPHFQATTTYPWPSARRMRLLESQTIGDVILLRYQLKETDDNETSNSKSASAPTEASHPRNIPLR